MLSATLLSLVLSSAAQQDRYGFGSQFRADAARRMIVLVVQQGIDSLPPVSGQAFGYDYDLPADACAQYACRTHRAALYADHW